MSVDFPDTPTIGQIYTFGSNEWEWSGVKWVSVSPTTLKLVNYQETVGTITSATVDLSTGNVFSDAPGTAQTYIFSNPPTTGTAYGFTLKVTPSATITITWTAAVDWAGGTAPDAPASGETDVFVFFTIDGGATYYGFQAGDAMA